MSAAQHFDADVVVVGAGPVGLTISNTLGQYGVRVLLLEKGRGAIDYPRAVGMDDECLRTIQGIGLAGGAAAPDPYHWMRFVTASGRCFASIEPRTDDFGWSRRNRLQPAGRRPGADGRPQALPQRRRCGWAPNSRSSTRTPGGVSLTVQHKGQKVNRCAASTLVASD